MIHVTYVSVYSARVNYVINSICWGILGPLVQYNAGL